MRLLHIASDGGLKLTREYIDDKDIPPYAILSHTWQEGQEIVFDDLVSFDNINNVDAQSKEGHRKIIFCAQQAQRDGLRYFWVDTCCIDKSNNSELSEAINSMFRYYRNAKKCYVRLSDVVVDTVGNDDGSSETWKPAFKTSKWFKRGWTLQELLAPTSVEFFSKDGELLGNKETLAHTIHDITRIPMDALRGGQLAAHSIEERFSWAEHRQTTRQEDGAYCLLGIFGVHAPPIYGEGKENALRRLKREITNSQAEKLEKIRNWLSGPDASSNYHKAHKQRQAETGLWLLHSERFTAWKAKPTSRLWLYGIPGCGKTVLSSTVIKNLLEHCDGCPRKVTVYFFFDFNDIQKQDPELMLRSLLCQLLERVALMPGSIDYLFLSYGDGHRQPSVYALLDLTRYMIRRLDQVYIILDALDECMHRSELMDVLETVAGWHLQNVHLLITSRRERDIEISLGTYIAEENTICLQSDIVNVDIERYVRQRLSDDKSLIKWQKDAAIKEEIESALMRGAHGMFRWAACQLDALAKCRNRAQLRKALSTLPSTLDQTYERILSRISEEDFEYASRILRWLTFSSRPLSIHEVAEVVAIDVTREPAFDRDEVLEDPLDAMDVCSSLVTISEPDGARSGIIITLAHYSVHEYLVSDRIKQGRAKQYSMQAAECHNDIAKGCLKYLLHVHRPEVFAKPGFKSSVLEKYSATFWSSHIQRVGEEKDETNHIVMQLLSTDNPAYMAWLQSCDQNYPYVGTSSYEAWTGTVPALHYAVFLGLSGVVELLLDAGAEVNAQGDIHGNALQVASHTGQEQIVQILLDKGADVNARSRRGKSTALEAASMQGHEQIVRMLLKKGADVNTPAGIYGDALHAAVAGGRERVVRILSDTNGGVRF